MDREPPDGTARTRDGLTLRKRKLFVAAIVVIFVGPIVVGLLWNAARG